MDESPAAAARKRTRLIAGCANCRERHLKCDSIHPSCRQCQVHGLKCNRTLKLKFKHELSTGAPSNPSFPTDQIWMVSSGALRFQDETPDIVKHYDDASFEQQAAPGTMINIMSEEPNLQSTQQLRYSTDGVLFRTDDHTTHEYSTSVTHTVGSVDPGVTTYQDGSYIATPTSSRSNQGISSLSKDIALSVDSHHSSSINVTPHQDNFEPFTDREADLMRNFAENMALWADVTDVERHFEIEVPRRALSNIMLRYAIFSFSSRHINRKVHRYDWKEALRYRNQALQLLIPQVSGPVEGLTEEHLAAVVILRLDEEMDIDDTQSHLSGATKILNSMASFSSSGGLGEACAWLCLRQDIYNAIEHRQPLRTNLENYQNSLWLRKDDDVSWANKMVLLLAKVLSYAFRAEVAERTANLRQLANQVDEWDQAKPLSFKAIKSVPRGKERGQRLPILWMLSPFHVLGIQYYHMAKVVLLLSIEQESDQSAGFKSYQQSRKIEKKIREHVLTILGLAISNPRAENTFFQARHALAVWGGVLRHQFDQEAAADFLNFMHDRTGWNVSKTMDALHELWHEDSE